MPYVDPAAIAEAKRMDLLTYRIMNREKVFDVAKIYAKPNSAASGMNFKCLNYNKTKYFFRVFRLMRGEKSVIENPVILLPVLMIFP